MLKTATQQCVVNTTDDPVAMCDRLGIPVLAEIKPHPDPLYGHLFSWPPEVEQFTSAKSAKSADDHSGGQHV